MSKQPPPAPSASAVGPCLSSTIAPPDHPKVVGAPVAQPWVKSWPADLADPRVRAVPEAEIFYHKQGSIVHSFHYHLHYVQYDRNTIEKDVKSQVIHHHGNCLGWWAGQTNGKCAALSMICQSYLANKKVIMDNEKLYVRNPIYSSEGFHLLWEYMYMYKGVIENISCSTQMSIYIFFTNEH